MKVLLHSRHSILIYQLLKRLRACDTVDSDAGPTLELTHAFLRTSSEDRIDLGILDTVHKESRLKDADKQSLVSLSNNSACCLCLRAEGAIHGNPASVDLEQTLLQCHDECLLRLRTVLPVNDERGIDQPIQPCLYGGNCQRLPRIRTNDAVLHETACLLECHDSGMCTVTKRTVRSGFSAGVAKGDQVFL